MANGSLPLLKDRSLTLLKDEDLPMLKDGCLPLLKDQSLRTGIHRTAQAVHLTLVFASKLLKDTDKLADRTSVAVADLPLHHTPTGITGILASLLCKQLTRHSIAQPASVSSRTLIRFFQC